MQSQVPLGSITTNKASGGDGIPVELFQVLNDDAEYIMRNAWRKVNNLRYANDTTLMAESEEELKSFLMKLKEESEKAGLKFNIQKSKITASGPITSWHPVPSLHGKDGGKMETERDFISLGSKISADGDCSHEIKRHLLLGRKANDKPRQHIKKQRHYFADKDPPSQSYCFSSSPVWM